MKRLLDVVLSVFALLALAPVMGCISLAVLLTSGRPILFKQERVGREFHPFYILKFRSMRQSTGALVTVKGDTRITPLGQFLRAAKLDELPQLWNVLRGDMSLVGPRPEVLQYVFAYPDRFQKVLTVRPGITDLASIRFRNEEDILASSVDPMGSYTNTILPAKLALAEEYVRQASVLLDLKILLETILVALLPARAERRF